MVPYRSAPAFGPDAVLSPPHRAAALDVATKSIVLLKNAGGLLPLAAVTASPAAGQAGAAGAAGAAAGTGRRFLMVGPNANDTYSMVGNYYGCSTDTWAPVMGRACDITTPLVGLQRALAAGGSGATVQYAMGVDIESKRTDGIAAAVAAVADSDVVVAVLGLQNCKGGQGQGGESCESEGHDRMDTLGLPGQQEPLLQALQAAATAQGKPLVLVLVNGGPVSSPWAEQHVAAIVEAWYGGAAGGTALADVLLGRASPSGRMPFTVPTSLSQVRERRVRGGCAAGARRVRGGCAVGERVQHDAAGPVRARG
jgi:beta-glucosidase